MIEKDLKLIKRVGKVLDKEDIQVMNTPFTELIEKLVQKIESDKVRMKMNQYQDLTARTAGHFDDITEEIVAWGYGIAGESGEVCDLIKKAMWHKHEWDHQKLAYELGDLLFYIARLSNVIGYSLDEVAVMNVEKLYRRYPNGFDSDKSINRYEETQEFNKKNNLPYHPKA